MNPFPPSNGGEEVTRNQLSYGYIMNNGLNSQAGIAKYLGGSGAKVDFPIGAVEIKAFWARGAIADAYQVGGFSLTGIHIMMKIAPRPNNPLHREHAELVLDHVRIQEQQGLDRCPKIDHLSQHIARRSKHRASFRGLGSVGLRQLSRQRRPDPIL